MYGRIRPTWGGEAAELPSHREVCTSTCASTQPFGSRTRYRTVRAELACRPAMDIHPQKRPRVMDEATIMQNFMAVVVMLEYYMLALQERVRRQDEELQRLRLPVIRHGVVGHMPPNNPPPTPPSVPRTPPPQG